MMLFKWVVIPCGRVCPREVGQLAAESGGFVLIDEVQEAEILYHMPLISQVAFRDVYRPPSSPIQRFLTHGRAELVIRSEGGFISDRGFSTDPTAHHVSRMLAHFPQQVGVHHPQAGDELLDASARFLGRVGSCDRPSLRNLVSSTAA
jgi:hypothetical protein